MWKFYQPLNENMVLLNEDILAGKYRYEVAFLVNEKSVVNCRIFFNSERKL